VRLLQKFTEAVEARDEQVLLHLFAPDATWTADGGGKTAAAPRPIVGAGQIARLVIGLRDKVWREDWRLELVTINGESGLRAMDGDRVVAVMSIDTDGERIAAVYAIVNPDKLAAAAVH
jgi:RNA polymerase sigma-70 factor (ECF subfamily)